MSEFLNTLPVVPLDEINDPVGMMEQGTKFAEWAMTLPNQPYEITLNYAPFDAMPRSWDVRFIGPDEVQASMLSVNIYDIYFKDVVVSSIMAAYPPEDDGDETIWQIGMMALLKELTVVLADMQTEYIADCFEADGWDAEAFLEETDPYMNHLQQRIFLQGHMYMYEIGRILRDHFDELPRSEQVAFPVLLEQIRKDFDQRLAECRQKFDAEMDDALTEMLDGK